MVIDWDGAGPASVRWERANYAVLWGTIRGSGCDEDRVEAFLRGYRDSGGDVQGDDAEVLPRWLAHVSSWTRDNLRMALEQPAGDQDIHAAALLRSLLAGRDTVAERQAALRRVLARLC